MKLKKIIFYFLLILSSSFSGVWLYKTFFTNEHQQISSMEYDNMTSDSSGVGTYIPVSQSSAGQKLMSTPFDFKEIIKRTKDAVVNVHNTRYVVQYYDFGFGYRESQPRKLEGTGSGVIISPDGYIVTNYHVIKEANEIEVTLNNKKKYKARIIGIDPSNDIAVIKIPARNLPYLTFGDSDKLELGEWVLAIGNPFNLGTTVTAGIVSAKARDLKGDNRIESFIQTDAVVNPGNSGGALINENGELVGINTMIFSMTGSYIGYSFAIPSNIVKKIAEDIIEYGSIQKSKIGISGIELNDRIAKELGISTTEGIWISDVDKTSSSYKAGIRKGDIIIGLDNKKISTMAELLGYLKAKRPGAKLKIKVIKTNGKIVTLPIILEKYDTAYISDWGITVKTMTRNELKKYGIQHGVLIAGVKNRDLVRNGIMPGHIILSVNNIPVYSADDVQTVFNRARGRISVEIMDDKGRVVKYIFG